MYLSTAYPISALLPLNQRRPLGCQVPTARSVSLAKSTNDCILTRDDAIRLLLAQFLRAAPVIGIQCRVEEIAHVVYDWAGTAEFGECAGTVAAEGRRKGAGFDELQGD